MSEPTPGRGVIVDHGELSVWRPQSGRGVYVAALAALPRVGPRRLHRLLAYNSPKDAWERVLNGSVSADVASDDLRRSWASHAAGIDLDELSTALDEFGVVVTTPGDPGHPARLTVDIDPSPVIFRQGLCLDPDAPAVTVVGTRRCSPTGRSVAFELGSGLAEAGVTVVSGLALGIDGAAHRGVLSVDGAPPVGVVGSGLNMVYPRGNSDLWRSVKEAGTLLSESPLDGRPEPWRFPARNRLLAALADVVVVVESKRSGGSLLTVEEAVRRGVTVMAVPGSVRNPAAVGVNALISDGCAPACGVDDVLTAVDMATNGRRKARSSRTDVSMRSSDAVGRSDAAASMGARSERTEVSSERREHSLSDRQRLLMSVIDDNPAGIDQVVSRSGIPVPAVLAEIAELEAMGLLSSSEGKIMWV